MADTDKLGYLPQLQRYDEKLKRWANNEFLTKVDAAATDVRIDGKSITKDGVADIPAAVQNSGIYGVVKLAGNSNGLRINSIGELKIVDADRSVIDSRASGSYPITTNGFDYAVKAAMCDGKGEAWTDEEQAAAKERMGIGNYSIPKATATTLGGVKVGNGLNVTNDGTLSVEMSSGGSSMGTTITATYDNTGTWNAVCNDTYNVIMSWFDKYDHVLAWVGSGENSLRPFPGCFVELIKMQKGRIVSTPFTIQYVVQSNNPRVRTGMTTTSLCRIQFNANGSINFQMSYSEVDQYADATEFTNTVNGDVSMLALKDGGITSAKLADGAVTADKIADGAITKAKLASDVGSGGGISISILTDIKKANNRNHIYVVHPDYPSVSFYLNVGYEKISDISSFIYGQIDAGDYIGLCVIGIGYSGRDISGYSSGSIMLCQTSTISDSNPTNIGLSGPGITNKKSSLFIFTDSISLAEVSITPKYNFVPKSTSAQAALASLLPVQDECEQMEAEAAKLEQDWIDNPDDMVAVDGNGVPITIATKKTELKKKQAELEKLREDYISKLGDWKNEVRE